jgi:F0F1-type ATP synthase assembly protein I
MDVTPIVVWLVIWGIMIFASIPLGALLGMTVGFFTGALSDNEDVGAPIGMIVGWIGGAALAVFSIIQVILHIIALVQATT